MNDIADPGSAGFEVSVHNLTIRLMVIRQGSDIYVYENNCPHRRLPLDFERAEWDGVRNYQASNNMKAMKKGDKAFFYHSVNEKQVVGTLEVVKEYYPDPMDKSERFGMVDFKALKPLKTPVTLQQVKDLTSQ